MRIISLYSSYRQINTIGVYNNEDVMVFTQNPSTWTRYNSNYGSVNWMGWEVSGTGWSVAWQQRICYQFQLKALLIMLMTSTNSTLKWALALCHVICVKYYINKCRLCWRYFIMLNNLLFWFVYGVNTSQLSWQGCPSFSLNELCSQTTLF